MRSSPGVGRRGGLPNRRLARRVVIRPSPVGAGVEARERFIATDRYRARREWQRYEGTAQRDLFRELRDRFLARHSAPVSRALDVGAGPGRFTARLGTSAITRRIALDIGREMLLELSERWSAAHPGEEAPDRILGDGARPPFADGVFGTVAVLGNLLGFAGEESEWLLEQVVALLSPGAILLLEVAPGPGESSRYLHRLPPRSVVRLLRSPPNAVALRIAREGFRVEPSRRKKPGEFRRVDAADLCRRLVSSGFRVEEVLAVAPSLGPDPERTEAVRRDPKAWGHLLDVEETVGRNPERWPNAAAVLVAATGPGGGREGLGFAARKSEG